MAPGGASVNVAKLPDSAMDVSNRECLHRRLGLVVEHREDRVGAETRDGKSAAVIGIRRRKNLCEGDDLIIFVIISPS